MRALVYHGTRDVKIDDEPRPNIEHPEDAILLVTSTALLIIEDCFISTDLGASWTELNIEWPKKYLLQHLWALKVLNNYLSYSGEMSSIATVISQRSNKQLSD
jgi:hypothetical protein